MRKRTWNYKWMWVWVWILSQIRHSSSNSKFSGCQDGSVEGFLSRPDLAACGGAWEGHVANSSGLCGRGWQVCSWLDKSLLQSISWEEATLLEGCYTFNAAQDNGRCSECSQDIEQDDLAAVGRGCPHQNMGQRSCIGRGRIDASCCVDAHLGQACQFRPGLASGVLCCRKPRKSGRRQKKIPTSPKIQEVSDETVSIVEGERLDLKCGVASTAHTSFAWYKDGRHLGLEGSNVYLIQIGGILHLEKVERSQAGLYSCLASGGHRSSIKYFTVVVKNDLDNPAKGCYDGSVEALGDHPDVRACSGSWQGHVRNSKQLCSTGWRVCNKHDRETLKSISWDEAVGIEGCYAYNAANNYGQCERCTDTSRTDSMAGVGKRCSQKHAQKTSCLPTGRIDVARGRKRNGEPSCNYQAGLTSGVLCCKIYPTKRKKQHPAVQCNPVCGLHGQCIAPNRCQCKESYQVDNNGGNCHLVHCRLPCLNGGRCQDGRCRCPPSHRGSNCQHVIGKEVAHHWIKLE